MNYYYCYYFKTISKVCTQQRQQEIKKEKNNGIMEGTNNRICEVDFEILLRVQKNRGRNHEAEAREREREPLEVRRRQERTQRDLESANAKLWLAEHFKQS